MMRKPLPRLLLQVTLACVAMLALPTDAGMARSVADIKKVQASDENPAYQRLVNATNAVVGVKVKALPNARSNETLGQERTGSGVVINADGLVLTIGYLILEADTVVVTDGEHTVPATVVAYDHPTGFGLLKPVGRIATTPIRLGTARPVGQLDRLMIVTGGDEQAVSIATVVSKRKFAGYWEYLIDDAIFTSPPRLDHSGAALINKDGELVGIGSLFVMDALTPGEKLPGNMFVPVDLLKPVLDQLVRTGSQEAARRPWLGVNSLEEDGRIKVMQVNEDSPAQKAGIEAGDIILSVDGTPVESLEKFYNTLWQRGPAGTEFTLTVLHGVNVRQVMVRSIDRREFVRTKPTV